MERWVGQLMEREVVGNRNQLSQGLPFLSVRGPGGDGVQDQQVAVLRALRYPQFGAPAVASPPDGRIALVDRYHEIWERQPPAKATRIGYRAAPRKQWSAPLTMAMGHESGKPYCTVAKFKQGWRRAFPCTTRSAMHHRRTPLTPGHTPYPIGQAVDTGDRVQWGPTSPFGSHELIQWGYHSFADHPVVIWRENHMF